MNVLLPLLICCFPASAPDSLQAEVQALAQKEARAFLARAPYRAPKPVHPRLKRPGAVFVTVTEHGKTRGCWGSLDPQCRTLAEEIAQHTRKALSLDYRFPPVNPLELGFLSFYVSLVGPLEPVERGLNPLREGLFVTDGSRGALLLPGEAKTARWAEAECRRKAGLGPDAPARLFRFRTEVFGPLGKGKR